MQSTRMQNYLLQYGKLGLNLLASHSNLVLPIHLFQLTGGERQHLLIWRKREALFDNFIEIGLKKATRNVKLVTSLC